MSLQMIFYNTGHSYKLSMFQTFLDQSFQTTRDLYQTELFGTFSTGTSWATEHNIEFPYTPNPRYFWVEAIPDTIDTVETTNFHAKIQNNQITMEFPVLPTLSHQIKIYLHSKMVDLTKPVTVMIDGVLAGTRDPAISTAALQSVDPSDPTFLYEDTMTVTLPTVASPAIYPTPTPEPEPSATPQPTPETTPTPIPTATPTETSA